MSDLSKKQGARHSRRALGAAEIVAKTAEYPGWVLDGDGTQVAIQKTYCFATYLETISFVNAVAFVAERFDHHPDMQVSHSRCVVRFSTHDIGGICITDFHCAQAVEALVQAL